MPSRKLKSPCQKCNTKNEYGSNYCSKCGAQLPANAVAEDDEYGDAKSQHRDIAHPITKDFREYLQSQILEAYNKEAGKSSSTDTSETALSGSNF
jgi:transcription initiation factor TFIIIB Brf1 subunit/transcription initiation factor TFIIB